VLTAFWGTLFPMEGLGVRVGQIIETEAAREPEERETGKRSMSHEDLRKKYLW
jgi:hypothetical protein